MVVVLVVAGIEVVAGMEVVASMVVDDALASAVCSGASISPAAFGHTTDATSNANVSDNPTMATRVIRADRNASPLITRRGVADPP